MQRRALSRAFSSLQQQGSLVQRLRDETPGTRSVLHLNNAGASLMPTCVSKAVIDHLELESNIGGYEAAAKRADEHEAVTLPYSTRALQD